MAASDPRNADWRRDLAIAEFRLATAFRLAGRLADAQPGYERAVDLLRPIAAASRTHAARQRDLASVEAGLGVTLLVRGAIQPALAQADAVQRLLAPLVERGTDPDAARIAAEARLLAADAWVRRGDRARAHAVRLEALALAAHAADQTGDRRTADVWARALLALDRVDEARPIVEQLFAQAYRHPALVDAWRVKNVWE